MEQSKLEQLQKEAAERFKVVHDSFDIGQGVELVSSSHEPDLKSDTEGIVLKKDYSQYGCDLRIDFDGYETWIAAEDVRSCDYK